MLYLVTIQLPLLCLERYPSGSLGHRPAPNDLREGDEDEYTEQLRQIQRAISPEVSSSVLLTVF